MIKRIDNTPSNKIRCRVPWAAHEHDRSTNEIVWTKMVLDTFISRNDTNLSCCCPAKKKRGANRAHEFWIQHVYPTSHLLAWTSSRVTLSRSLKSICLAHQQEDMNTAAQPNRTFVFPYRWIDFRILLIVQYNNSKSCYKDFVLQNLILRTRLCGTGFLTQPNSVFISSKQKSVRCSWFVWTVYHFWKGISAGPALKYFTWSKGAFRWAIDITCLVLIVLEGGCNRNILSEMYLF